MLPMTCLEREAMFDATHRLDVLLLLEVITMKLEESTERVLASDPAAAVVVYGGALHNDLYPRWPLDALSYAAPLALAHGPGSVLELDLVTPAIAARLPLARAEPWFPLLTRASPDRAIVWQRGPSSYVVILPGRANMM